MCARQLRRITTERGGELPASAGGRVRGGGDIDQVFAGKGNDFIEVIDGDPLDEVDCGPGKDEVKADPGDTVAANCEKVS
jgi:hypothetical protein